MNKKRAKKYNMRRKFFNEGKGKQCGLCGSLLVHVKDLTGEPRGIFCPLC